MVSKKARVLKPAKAVASGIAVGLNRGHIVTPKPTAERHVAKKGKLNPRIKMIREVIREVSGFAPYERRVMELLKSGSASTSKRALKLSKKRLGTHTRGKKKREELQNVIIQQRKKAQQHA